MSKTQKDHIFVYWVTLNRDMFNLITLRIKQRLNYIHLTLNREREKKSSGFLLAVVTDKLSCEEHVGGGAGGVCVAGCVCVCNRRHKEHDLKAQNIPDCIGTDLGGE